MASYAAARIERSASSLACDEVALPLDPEKPKVTTLRRVRPHFRLRENETSISGSENEGKRNEIITAEGKLAFFL